jgi:hypothetical protein
LALLVIAPGNRALLACPTTQGAGITVDDCWTAVYRLAYEQARAALEPSRFQKLNSPSWN